MSKADHQTQWTPTHLLPTRCRVNSNIIIPLHSALAVKCMCKSKGKECNSEKVGQIEQKNVKPIDFNRFIIFNKMQ